MNKNCTIRVVLTFEQSNFLVSNVWCLRGELQKFFNLPPWGFHAVWKRSSNCCRHCEKEPKTLLGNSDTQLAGHLVGLVWFGGQYIRILPQLIGTIEWGIRCKLNFHRIGKLYAAIPWISGFLIPLKLAVICHNLDETLVFLRGSFFNLFFSYLVFRCFLNIFYNGWRNHYSGG